MSEQASGTMAGKLTFSSWKGRPYVKVNADRDNPDTELQSFRRQEFAFLKQAWSKDLTDADRATWTALAEKNDTSPATAFFQENTPLDNDDWGPHKQQGATPGGPIDLPHPSTAFEAGTHAVRLHYKFFHTGTLWGIRIISQFEPAGPNELRCLKIFSALPSPTTHRTPWFPVKPGTYSFDAWAFDNSGLWESVVNVPIMVIP